MDSILQSIKKLLGISEEYTVFDQDLIIHINTAFNVLHQLGVGPTDGFMIYDESDSWDDYISSVNLMMIKSYVYLKVKLLFDPPSSGILVDSTNRMISELEWRILVEGGEK